MAKEDCIEIEGIVEEACPGAIFKVKLPNNHIITAYLSGKLHMHNIKILEGDSVKVEMSPYDMTKGRIVWRDKK
jgi:translation initiation factor IF-1